jgi:septal ring factor EnvC (AmiA/AmiB activator)
VYKCLDEEGHVTYTNTKPSPKAKCTALSRDQRISTVPAGRATPATPSPAGFPKVDGDTQKARDTDRRKILEQELATEQKNLDQAKKELAEQEAIRTGDERSYDRVIARLQPYKDKVALHERNIEALKKEIGTLK